MPRIKKDDNLIGSYHISKFPLLETYRRRVFDMLSDPSKAEPFTFETSRYGEPKREQGHRFVFYPEGSTATDRNHLIASIESMLDYSSLAGASNPEWEIQTDNGSLTLTIRNKLLDDQVIDNARYLADFLKENSAEILTPDNITRSDRYIAYLRLKSPEYRRKADYSEHDRETGRMEPHIGREFNLILRYHGGYNPIDKPGIVKAAAELLQEAGVLKPEYRRASNGLLDDLNRSLRGENPLGVESVWISNKEIKILDKWLISNQPEAPSRRDIDTVKARLLAKERTIEHGNIFIKYMEVSEEDTMYRAAAFHILNEAGIKPDDEYITENGQVILELSASDHKKLKEALSKEQSFQSMVSQPPSVAGVPSK